MASNTKRARPSSTFNLEDVIAFVQESDDEHCSDSDSRALCSGKESEIGRKLLDFEDESSGDEQEAVPPEDSGDDYTPPDQNSIQDALPPVGTRVKPVGEYEIVHVPIYSTDVRRYCKVCYKKGRGQIRVYSYCSTPQCQVYLHITKERNCFQEWHTMEFHKEK